MNRAVYVLVGVFVTCFIVAAAPSRLTKAESASGVGRAETPATRTANAIRRGVRVSIVVLRNEMSTRSTRVRSTELGFCVVVGTKEVEVSSDSPTKSIFIATKADNVL